VRKVIDAIPVLPLALALSVPGITFPQAPKKGADSEQLVFRAEDKVVERPVPIPRDVFDILVSAGVVPSQFDNGYAVTPENLPQSWFSASIVHLAGRFEKDLIVTGGGAMGEGNVKSFWIFRSRYKTFELLLAGVPALRLEIKDTRSHGYRDIDITSPAAVDERTSHLQFREGSYQRVENEPQHFH
jgi:hypothetical protein